jgi:hypothetical protein
MNKNAIFYYKPGSTDGHETTEYAFNSMVGTIQIIKYVSE